MKEKKRLVDDIADNVSVLINAHDMVCSNGGT